MLPETRKERDSVFAPREITQIIIAWIVLSLAISLSYVGGLPQGTSDYLEIIAAFIATATGFILHEMGHKFEAMRLGYTAHFKIWAVGIASNSGNSSSYQGSVYLRCAWCSIHCSRGRDGGPRIYNDPTAKRRPGQHADFCCWPRCESCLSGLLSLTAACFPWDRLCHYRCDLWIRFERRARILSTCSQFRRLTATRYSRIISGLRSPSHCRCGDCLLTSFWGYDPLSPRSF